MNTDFLYEKIYNDSITVTSGDNLLSDPYTNVAYFFLVAFFLSVIMFSAAFILSMTNLKDNEKLSEYECGFEPFDNATRHPFDVHFYVVGILFLIFDVEIAILFP
jgi:NADH-quinone oxidoreductase subunit A